MAVLERLEHRLASIELAQRNHVTHLSEQVAQQDRRSLGGGLSDLWGRVPTAVKWIGGGILGYGILDSLRQAAPPPPRIVCRERTVTRRGRQIKLRECAPESGPRGRCSESETVDDAGEPMIDRHCEPAEPSRGGGGGGAGFASSKVVERAQNKLVDTWAAGLGKKLLR